MEETKFQIHAAARDGHLKQVESLLNANPKLAYIQDSDGRLPIHWAVSHNHEQIITLLVSVPSFDPDVPDSSGWTPLMIASSLPSDAGLETVQLLLFKGADPNAVATNGATALHFAASKANLGVARLLTEKKASARTKDRRGQVALHRAAAVGSVPMIKLLVGSRSPINLQDVDGLGALHHAISEGHGDAALFLLKEGAESDKEDLDGRLPIDTAPDVKIRSFILTSAEREGIDVTTT